MTTRSVAHDSFTIERFYPASPARVFFAWSDRDAKAAWFGGAPDELNGALELDFRVGGIEANSGRPPGGALYTYEARYHDIVPEQRIAYSYTMQRDGVPISLSIAVVELRVEGDGTRLTLTEHGAFFDGLDTNAAREHGTNELMNALGVALDHRTSTV